MKQVFCGSRCAVLCFRWFFFFSLLLFFPGANFAATLFCQTSSIVPAERSLKVSCKVADFPTTGKLEIRFADRFAGIEGLSERVYGIIFKDANGQRLMPEILGRGVYRITPTASSSLTLEYQLRLAEVNGIDRKSVV